VKSCLIINALFAFLVLILSLTATLGVPLRNAAWWILVLYVTGVAVRKELRLRFHPRFALAAIVAGVVIIGAVGLHSFRGCFPSDSNDAWSYAALGQYLVDYPRATHGALPYIDRYAAILSTSRFGTPSLLGFLSVISHLNTCRMLLPFLLLILANALIGFYLLTRVLGAGKITAFASGIFFVLCGWTSDAIVVGSLDNLLFLSLCGGFIARLILVARGCRSWAALGTLAINAAALFYSYPEGVLLSSLIFAPFVLQTGFRAWKTNPRLLLRLAMVPAAAFVFIMPYVPTWIPFFSSQISAMHTSSRPGEGLFPGLLGSALIPSVLGSRTEFSPAATTPAVSLAGTVLVAGAVVLCLTGLFRFKSRRLAGAAAFIIFLGLVVLNRVHLRYDYGLYKVLLIGSLIWLPALFVGIDGMIRNVAPRNQSMAAIVSCLIFQSLFLLYRFHNRNIAPFNPVQIRPFEEVQGLNKIVGKQVVALACEGDFQFNWAVYFGRRLNMQILGSKGYFRAYESAIFQSHDNEQTPAYLLSDHPLPGSIWQNGIFLLTVPASGTFLVSVDAPGGQEFREEKKAFRIGNQPVTFFVNADKQCAAILTAEIVTIGPSIRPADSLTIWVKTGNQVQEMAVSDELSIPLQLHPGINEAEIWCTNKLLGLLDCHVDPDSK
jgi:hypothetical protein